MNKLITKISLILVIFSLTLPLGNVVRAEEIEVINEVTEIENENIEEEIINFSSGEDEEEIINYGTESGETFHFDCSEDYPNLDISLNIGEMIAGKGYAATMKCDGTGEIPDNLCSYLGSKMLTAFSKKEVKCVWNGMYLYKLEIGEGITSIGKNAFSNQVHLKELSLPSTLKVIDDSAFYCSFLAQDSYYEIELPNSIEEIHTNAFDGYLCIKGQLPSSLKMIGDNGMPHYLNITGNLPEGLTEVGLNALSSSDKKAVSFTGEWPKGLTKIGKYAFNGCTFSEDFSEEWFEGAEEIGEYAFEGCTLPEKIIFAEGVKEIKKGAFKNCKGIKSVIFPSTLEKINDVAFKYCQNLEEIVFNSDPVISWNPEYRYRSGYADYDVETDQYQVFSYEENLEHKNKRTKISHVSPNANTTKYYWELDKRIEVPVVTFNPNGGEWEDGTDVSKICDTDDNDKLVGTIETPKWPTRKFLGWSENADATSPDATQPTNGMTVNKSKTYYAVWKSFDIKRDAWLFRNYESYFTHASDSGIYITDADYNELIRGLSNQEKALINRELSKPFKGECFGMSSTAVLHFNGAFRLRDFTGDPRYIPGNYCMSYDTGATESLMTYYFTRQDVRHIRDLGQIGRYGVDESENVKNILAKMESTDAPVMLNIRIDYNDGWKGLHAVVAYNYVKDEEAKTVTFNVYDCNDGNTLACEDESHPHTHTTYPEYTVTVDYETGEVLDYETWRQSYCYDDVEAEFTLYNVITADELLYDNYLVAPGKSENGTRTWSESDASGRMFFYTNYPSFKVFDSFNKEENYAVVEYVDNKTKITEHGNFSLISYGPVNNTNEETVYLFSTNADYNKLMFSYVGDVELQRKGGYLLNTVYDSVDKGTFINIISDDIGSYNFSKDGNVSASFENNTKHEITVAKNSITTPYYEMTLSAESKGEEITECDNVFSVVSAEGSLSDIKMRSDNDEIVLSQLNVDEKPITVEQTDSGNCVVKKDGEVIAKGKTENTVSFDALNGTPINTVTAVTGGKIAKPEDPTKEGFVFAGWFKESELINPWNFDEDIVTEDITLYAKWTVKGSDEEEPVNTEDIPEKGYIVRIVGDDGKEIKEGIYSTEYTGYKITPKVHVYHDRKRLVEGRDYKLAYGNNTNAAKSTASKAPYVKVTGLGEYASNTTIKFEIKQVNLKDCEYDETVKIKKGSKFTPVITFDGYELNSKCFNLNKTDKWTQSGKLTVTGKGNFTDSIEINVEVMDNAPKSVKVTLSSAKLYYNGSSQIPVITVKDSKNSSKTLEIGKDYKVSVAKDTTNAGKHSIMVRGIGDYAGKVVKKYTINPKKLSASDISYKVTPSVSYNATGANTKVESIEVNVGGVKTPIILNKDYKIACKNNKKAGTANYQISFSGNYKGTAAIKGTYIIEKAKATDFRIVPIDKSGYKKPGVYAQVPLIEYDNRAVGKNDYTIKYYLDSNYTSEMGKKNPLVIDADKDYAIVYVLITGKNNFDSSSIKTEYKVYKTPSSGVVNLSKATVTINPKTCKYNGSALTPTVTVTYKEGKATKTLDSSKYTVEYFNNKYKGKATVVVTGNGTDAIGSKINTFKITNGSILDLFVR